MTLGVGRIRVALEDNWLKNLRGQNGRLFVLNVTSLELRKTSRTMNSNGATTFKSSQALFHLHIDLEV